MTFLRRTVRAAAGLLALGGAGPARAASSATVHVEVSILSALSVSVDASASSTQTVVWNTAVPNQIFTSPSTATVTNDSGARTSRWALSTNAGSINLAGGPDAWALDASTGTLPGPDQFAVQAVFGSSNTATLNCPNGAAADWEQGFAPPLTALPVVYTSTVFADPSLNDQGTPFPDITNGGGDGRMHAGSRRALCWRIILPSSTSTVDAQNIQIIVTATP